MSSRFALFALLLVPAGANAQAAPRVIIAFDTSSSMAEDVDGRPTFGDGVMTNCQLQPAGHYCGTNCTAGLDTNCDGLVNDSRMFVAKEALRNVLRNAGIIDFALSRFDQNQMINATCNVVRMSTSATEMYSIDNMECDGRTTSYGNPMCNTDNLTGCPSYDVTQIPSACRPGSSGLPAVRALDAMDGAFDDDAMPLTNPQVCINYIGDRCDATAMSGDVLVGFPDLGAYVGRTNVPGILKWIDNVETAFDPTLLTGDVCNHAAGGDCELRPMGQTALAGVLLASRNYLLSVRSSDSAAACRPYSIVLLTDGAESCGGDPAAVARMIFDTDGIKTYVIGLSVESAEQAAVNSIAMNGGTGQAAFLVDDPDALSAALSAIVADTVPDVACALPCDQTEFGYSCPPGRTPQEIAPGECFCVAPQCDDAMCATQTVEQSSEVRCAPAQDAVAPCVCKNNVCTFACDGVVCAPGTVCDPDDPNGRCVEDNCRGLGCPSGQICDAVSGVCQLDPCENVSCAPDQACRDGVCEDSCAGVVCPSGSICEGGACQTDPCAGVSCAEGEVCLDGACMADACIGVRCASMQVCDPRTGACIADPCNTLRCPTGQQCSGGECVRASIDAGVDGGWTDAGGCNCRVGAAPRSSGAPFLFVAALAIVRRRRRRTRD